MAEKMENTEGTSGTSVAQVEGDIHIDPALVSHSVYVTGYKSTAKSEDLVIHFQRTKNGGGDIEGIVMSKQGTAVITFDNPEGKMFMVYMCLQCMFRRLKPRIATLRLRKKHV